jgi:hypothetical protein
MREDQRVWAIKQLLFEYVASPSLKHIREPASVNKLANEIVRSVDRGESMWGKWTAQRELLTKSAVPCWIPVEDLRDFLNGMPGQRLTTVDVDQRRKAFEEEDFSEFAKEEFRAGCEAVYRAEKAAGTELPAIVGLLREHIALEEDRSRAEFEQRWKEARDAERLAQERRLMSGADCKWTQIRGSKAWYCRVNGRAYRLLPTTENRQQLHRVQSVSDAEKGILVGVYQRRGDVTKVIAKIAYQPEGDW